MDCPARTVKNIVQEIEYPASRVLIVVAECNLNPLDMTSLEVPAVLGISEEIGLAHIKVEINRIERYERREQRRRTRRRTTPRDQVSNRNKMRPNAAAERRRDAAVIEVELCIADSRFGLFDRSARRPLIGYALVNVFDRSSVALLQIFGTVKLPVSQFQSSRRNLKLGVCFGKRNFVWPSINCEKDVALANNVPVLEKYSRKRTAYLRAQFDLRNRRELAKEAQPRIDVLRQRLAHHDLWKCSKRSTGGTSARPGRILEPCTHKHYPCQPSGNPQLGRRSS